MRRAGWITASAGALLVVAALVWNSLPHEDPGANIGAGVLFLFALCVMGLGATLFLVGVHEDDVTSGVADPAKDAGRDRTAWR